MAENRFLSYLTVTKDLVIVVLLCIYYLWERAFELLFPRSFKSLKGEVILITGSGNGIGKQMCLYMANSGATLVCWDINKEDNDKLVWEINSMGGKAIGYHVDVSDRMEVEKACASVKSQVGDVTMIINNAGLMPCVKFLDESWKSLDVTFKVNVLSHFWIIKEFLPKMIENKRGHIVVMCSVAGLIGVEYFVSYCSSKYAVEGYMEALKSELELHPDKPDIKFTTVYPTQVNTPTMARNNISVRFPSLIPRLLDPTYVAKQVIDGMRRDDQYVYIPLASYFASFFSGLNPKIRKLIFHFVGAKLSAPTSTQ